MAKITNTNIKQVVDENGEIKYSETSHTVNFGKEPNYVKLYLDDILYLSDLPKGYNSILYAFIKRMGYGNELVLNAALKRMIAAELELSVSSVNNALSKFVKGQLFKRIETGIYLVNPQIFGKGEWKDISRIRLTAQYDLKGRTIMAEITRKGEESDYDAQQAFYAQFEEDKANEEEAVYFE